MQRTDAQRKKSLKKSSNSQLVSAPVSNSIISAPDHPCLWRIIQNNIDVPSDSSINIHCNHPSIVYRPSVFSIHERRFTRLSFQNFNKRLEPLMMKYGLKQELKHLEDGEIDPNDEKDNDDDDDDEDENENGKKSIDIETDHKPVSTLVKTIGKKFAKKPFSRVQFDNKSRTKKRRRRPHPERNLSKDN